MKTSEEIKRGLVTCTELVMPADVQHAAMADALAYIQQLETENHQLLTKAQQLESTISQVSKALCGKENATLKELLKAADQLKARAPRWISVEERLPKEFETVIIWRSDCHQACIGWLIGGHWSVPKGVEVTYWMPLPEAPEEDDYAAD